MKSLMSAFALCLSFFVNQVSGAERTIVVPRTNDPFVVSQDKIVRLTGSGISGSSIKIQINGPVTLISENSVEEVAGTSRVIGSTRKEYELKPRSAGKVRVIITVKPPQPNSDPSVTEYEFTIQ